MRHPQIVRRRDRVVARLVRWTVRHNIAAADEVCRALVAEHPTVIADNARMTWGKP